MIQSISFGTKYDENGIFIGKNTWDDWHRLPTERPVFQPPSPKTVYLDVPGGNGSLDMSESLAGYPVYNNREGTFVFRVMNGYTSWQHRYEEILSYLHGRAMNAVLHDDPDWMYQGRFTVDGWKAGDTWSEITLGYNVNPFKWSIISSTDRWIWNPFNFESGIIWEDTFREIKVTNTSWVTFNFTTNFFGRVPISPTFTVSGAPSTGIEVIFKNPFLGFDNTENPITLYNDTTFVPDIVFFGQTGSYETKFRATSEATVTIAMDFRVGRL